MEYTKKTVVKDGGKDVTDTELCNMFNNFFINAPHEIRNNISPSSVGVTKVTYIQPDQEQENIQPENITLPLEQDESIKDACTLKDNCRVKSEALEDNETEEQTFLIEDNQEFPNEDMNAIADAVKATLAAQTDINLTGQFQLKVNPTSGKSTQVEVTLQDGSVILMELVAEDDDGKVVEREDSSTGIEVDEEGELKIFKCPHCPKSFSRRIQLRRHASVHMQQRGFSCGICEKWFPTRSALLRHERIHTGERPFQCEVCQKSFAQKEILFRHLITHTGQKPYAYNLPKIDSFMVAAFFANSPLYTSAEIRGIKADRFVEVGKERNINSEILRFFVNEDTTLAKLGIHQLLLKYVGQGGSSAEDVFTYCSTVMTDSLCYEACQATVEQSQNTLWHQLRSGRITSSRIYEASRCKKSDGVLYCGKKLNLKLQFVGLLLSPNFPFAGASPDAVSDEYVVEVKCPISLKTKELVHIRTHSSTDPTDILLHYCSVCPKVFCHASGLSRHLVTHTGKQFKCRHCEKQFTDKSSLRRHCVQTNHM
nr:unnamed protein product [Callosobruchus analis]